MHTLWLANVYGDSGATSSLSGGGELSLPAKIRRGYGESSADGGDNRDETVVVALRGRQFGGGGGRGSVYNIDNSLKKAIFDDDTPAMGSRSFF